MQPNEIVAATGIDRLAEGLGIAPGTVKQWKTRNSIPAEKWPAISRAFPDLTIEKLEAAFQASKQAA